MVYEVAVAGVVLASLAAAGIAYATLGWGARWPGRGPDCAADARADRWAEPDHSSTSAADLDAQLGAPDFEERNWSALAACVFTVAPADHICWTVMVVDPALHGTPSHVRLVGHYDTEFDAIDAAALLADALNECLIPGEAPLTATALGIEAAVRPDDGITGHQSADYEPPSREVLRSEPRDHIGRPIIYGGTPLGGRAVPTGFDDALCAAADRPPTR